MLLDSGAGKFLNTKNTSGQTPFHIAAAIDASEPQTLKILQLLKDANPNERDIDGRTPLHLAVNTQKTAAVKYLLDIGAIADTPDFGDTTPFELAAQSKNFKILCLLFPKILGTIKPINASQWRSIIPRAEEEGIIKMTGGKHANVEIMDRDQFTQYLNDRSYSFSAVEAVAKEKSWGNYTIEKQIFILWDEKDLGHVVSSGVQCRWWRRTLKDKIGEWGTNLKESRWTAQMNTVPSAVTISKVRSGECFLECRLALPVLTPNQLHELPDWIKPSRQLKKNYAFIWIMVKPESSTASNGSRETLVSRTFFSTLEYAAVPNSATDLFVPLVQQLHGEWGDLYTAAEEHLSDMRTRVLVSNGRDSKLIGDLLLDARLWGWLRKLSEGQALTLRTLEKNYKTRGWTVLHEEGKDITEDKIKSFERETDNLTEQMDRKLKSLEAASQELIQLEFNLTSIAEAQKSTSTNISMKRLSWITFVFLPLMFISSVFGMNVDILKSNPRWWIYILFALGTMILTLGVWILFKRKNLEGWIEERFQWLVKGKSVDEEKGLRTTLNAGTWKGKAKIT
ncbi:Ankyrin-2 [Peltigera leucophlebia]|nr:Ankyrin-2 [Peltigera leucophlebia]